MMSYCRSCKSWRMKKTGRWPQWRENWLLKPCISAGGLRIRNRGREGVPLAGLELTRFAVFLTRLHAVAAWQAGCTG